MRPAVCSAILEQVLDFARLLPAHQLEHRGRQLFRQVVDQGRRVVRRQLLDELGDLFGRPAGQQLRARLGPELAERLHRQPAVALDQHGEHRDAARVSGSSPKICARSAGCCFWSRFDRLAVAPTLQKALDRVEDEIDLPLRRHTNPLL